MGPLRFVLLDYPKLILENPDCQKALSDLFIIREKNYARTNASYIAIDKQDMIGTHILIYDTEKPFNPTLISALRITYDDRALSHKLSTPLQTLLPLLDHDHQSHYRNFRSRHPVLADCGTWFIDENYTQKNSGLKLSNLIYTLACFHVLRLGIKHLAGCTNEKYHASRRLEPFGTFKSDFKFTHPHVQDPHLLILLENFKKSFLQSVFEEYKTEFETIYEVLPQGLQLPSIHHTIHTELYAAESDLDKVISINSLRGKKAG